MKNYFQGHNFVKEKQQNSIASAGLEERANAFEIFVAEINLLSKLSSPVNGSNIQRMFSEFIPV